MRTGEILEDGVQVIDSVLSGRAELRH